MSHEALHESAAELKPATLDMHRAIVSVIEELEAVDWYQQRGDGARVDPAERSGVRQGAEGLPLHERTDRARLRSNRSRFITLVQALAKSCTNLRSLPSQA